jgi:hypothetical protein
MRAIQFPVLLIFGLLIQPSDSFSNVPFTLAKVEERAYIVSREDTVAIPRIHGTIKIDGMLHESFWNEAIVWELPYEIRVGENDRAPMDTYVLMASTAQEFLIAFICLDPQPNQIRATLTDRNRWSRTEDDHVGLYIDTFGDKRNAYYISVNARGVQFDAMRLDRGGQGTVDDSSFDFLWESAAHITEFGYIVEISLPYRNLRLSNSSRNERLTWNIKPFRVIPRSFRFETVPVKWDYNRNCFLCQIPAVTMENPERSGKAIQMIPYVSGFYENTPSTESFDPSYGIDIKYQQAEWTFDVTILPDFSQVETDAFQMTTNIRFLPQFPERRPFFTERTDLMRFPISQTIYTRTLLDPTVGFRGTGKTGPHNWIALGLHDKATWLLFPGRDSSTSHIINNQSLNSLFRYRYDKSADAVMGVLVTSKDFEGGYTRLISADGQFAIDSRHTFVSQVLSSITRYPFEIAESLDRPTDEFFGYGYLLRVERSGRIWNYRIETRDYEESLVTGMGLQQRVGIRTGYAQTSFDVYPDREFIRRIGSYLIMSGTWDRINHDPLNLSARGGLILSAAYQIYADINFQQERESFIGEDFDLSRYGIFFRIIPAHWYTFNTNFSIGDAIDYRLVEQMHSFNGWLSNTFYFLNRQLQLSHNLNYYRLFHNSTAQDAWIHRTFAELQITPSVAIRNIAQWRDFAWKDPRYFNTPDKQQTFENQFLIRYRFNYATAFYAGAYGRWDTQDTHISNMWQVFAKISYLI